MRLLSPVLFTCANALLFPNLKRLDDNALALDAADAGVAPMTSAGNSSTSSGYIVVLKEGKEEAEYEEHDQWVLNQLSELQRKKREEDPTVEFEVEFFNVSSFHGYAGDIPEPLLGTIRESALVDFVEQDRLVTAASITTQNNAPWGLARISHRQRDPVSKDYTYDTEGGRGVTVFVLDTGIQVKNPEFQGRARWGKSIRDPLVTTDLEGHGTHVAGIIGSKTYGVAKKADLVAVQVLDQMNKGFVSNFIGGLQYAMNKHRKLIRNYTPGFKGSIINLSLGCSPSNAFDRAVNAAVRDGMHVVASAGNGNMDACNRSPARATGAITVGSTDEEDRRSQDSNFGSCVDIYAPGVDIPSVGITATPHVRSGTSQAAPHVTGLLAYLLSLQPDQGSDYFGKTVLSPEIMREVLFTLAVRDVVTGIPPNTANVFAYNGAVGVELAQALELVGPNSADNGDAPI